MFAVIIGTVMLILAVSLYSFVGHQHTGIQSIVNGEIAHFLAEAGINSSIGSVREAVAKIMSGTSGNRQLNEILLKPGDLEDVCINDMLDASWNTDLEAFAREMDKDASIKVDVWLRDLKICETAPSSWADPIAKDGYLVIESTGTFKGTSRIILIKRRIRVGSTVPAWLSKFSLFVNDAARAGEGGFNLIRNDYRGMITDGPKPLIVYNHATPDAPFEAGNMSDILREEVEAEVWQRRGWLWMGGRRSRLNLCSGAGDLGEIFHFYDVSNPNIFSPVKFSTPQAALPEAFSSSLLIPWDKSSSSVRQVSYKFGHSFVLDGFHDRSNRKESDAMYEGNILSSGEKNAYTSKSSILHLFGDARKGYQSRTRVFGNVHIAFPRYASLEVKTDEPDVEALFAAVNPPPLYLLPSVSESAWHNSIMIQDIMGRQFGGPLLQSGMLCRSYADYAQLMSRISELPYAESYNSMQDVYSNKANRVFPSDAGILAMDTGLNVEIVRNAHVFFKGRPTAQGLLQVIENRTQIEVDSISDFWKRFLNERGELELNAIVSIKNSRQLDMQIPAAGKPQPMVVKGGGIILLKQGNLVLRGITCTSPDEALTVALAGNGSVSFSSTQPNHVNIVAPNAELGYGSKFDIYGSLCVGSIYADHRFQGGTVRFRPGQDPTTSGYNRYYKVFIDPRDSFWNE